jgi:hypothetical protein
MGKRNSTVALFGEIKLKRLLLDNSRSLWSSLTVASDLPQLGGEHAVVASGYLAVEALAFVLTAKAYKLPLPASVIGWLYSTPARCYVVANELNFHVTDALREQAVGVLKQLGSLPFPQEVQVNGWKVDILKCLSGVADERLFA